MARKPDREITLVLIREVCDLLRKAVPWLAIGWIAWCAVLMARAFAGQLTVAQIQFLVGAFFRIGSPLPAWVLAVLCIGYAHLQRRERLRKTAYLQERIISLELKLDPNRSSSTLEVDGTTREEDRL